MSGRLSLPQVLLLLVYAGGMIGGQLLFKLASTRFAGDAPWGEKLTALMQSAHFIAAMALYFGLALLWVWVLSFTPLSRAYPFVALAFAITPLLGGLVFAEPLSVRLLMGIALILGGLILVAG